MNNCRPTQRAAHLRVTQAGDSLVRTFDSQTGDISHSQIWRLASSLPKLRDVSDIGQALSEAYPPETDTEALMIGKNTPRGFYFCGDNFIRGEFPFQNHLSWEEFLGASATASYAPIEGSDFYAEFEQKVRNVFERFSSNGVIEQNGITELYFGTNPILAIAGAAQRINIYEY